MHLPGLECACVGGPRATTPGFWQPAPQVRHSPARGSIVPLGVGFLGVPSQFQRQALAQQGH
eukprot:11182045-Lingulodinium_polyedra.AAC.1